MTRKKINRRVANVPFAGVRRMLEKADQLAASGRKIIHFEIGRPDFDTPAHIKEAAKAALDAGFVHYTSNWGIPALRAALVESILKDRNIQYDPEKEIIVTAGGQEALYLSLRALVEDGDEVLVPDPGFGQYYTSTQLAGGIPVSYPLLPGRGFSWDVKEIAERISARTKAIIVNSPHNPTGKVATKEELTALAELAREHELFVISDEAYDKMVYEGYQHYSIASFPGMKERTALCGSFSKTYAMTGWRMGYLAGPPELLAAVVKLQQNVMLSVNSFAQKGVLAAIKGPQDSVYAMLDEFARRRKVILDGISSSPALWTYPPQGTFYAYVKYEGIDINSLDMADYLLDEAGVAVVPGTTFGQSGEGFFRISYATSYDDCLEGIEKIVKAIDRLRR